MSMTVSEERAVRQREVAEALKASGALDGIFAQIDAGTPLTGQDGLLTGVVKAALERGLVGRAERASGPMRRATRTRRRIRTHAMARVVRRPAPRPRGTWIWTCPGRGPARCTAMLVPNGAAPWGRAGRDDHPACTPAELMRARHPGTIWLSPSAQSRCHETINTGHRSDQRGGLGLADPAWGGPLPGDLPGRDHGQDSWRGSCVQCVQQGRPYRRGSRHGGRQARPGDLGTWPMRDARVLGRGVRRAGQPRYPGRAGRVTGGLTGFPEAIQATWPQATVQTCVVHLIRAATRNASLQGPQGRVRRAQTGVPGR